MRIYLIFIFSIVSILPLFSQRRATINIVFDTEKLSITEEQKLKIPFDEEFYISGAFGKESKVKWVELKFKIKDHCINLDDSGECSQLYNSKRHYYLTDKLKQQTIDSNEYVHLEKFQLKNGNFKFLMDALHPNETYELVFIFTEEYDIPNHDKLNQQISHEIKIYFQLDTPISPLGYIALNEKIKTVILESIDYKTLYNFENEELTFNTEIFQNKYLQEIYNNAYATNGELRELQSEITCNTDDKTNCLNGRIMDSIYNVKPDLLTSLDSLLLQEKYSTDIKSLADKTINDQMTIQDLLLFIKNDIIFFESSLESRIYQILNGDSKFNGKSLIKSQNFDLASGQLLLENFEFLNKKLTENKNLIPLSYSILPLIKELISWCSAVTNYNILLEKKNKEIKILNELYPHLMYKNKIESSIPLYETLNTDQSSYFGLDIGFMFAPDIGSTFFFEGLNMHIRPVNRNTDFKKLKGMDKVLKQVSIFAGVAQRIGSYDDNFEKLLPLGSPFTGLGWRIHKGFRVNAGVLFYKYNNYNPIISESEVDQTWFISISVDAELKEIFKAFIP